MIHLGDITKINGAEVPLVDIVVGGSPCQDLSVAGKREGLAGARSGLFMEQIRIIKEMREHDRISAINDLRCIRPRFMVWENVPGAFSSNKGEDFRAVLEETARIADEAAVIPRPAGGKWQPAGCIMGDGWSVAWRVHDAQFWGVPQRRKRIALVADFAGGGAPEILFERESVPRDPAESGEEGKTTSRTVKEDPGETISFQERFGCEGGAREYSYNMSEPVRSQQLTTNTSLNDEIWCLQGNGIDRADTAGCNGKGFRKDQCYTLNTIDRPAVCVSQDAYDKYTENDKSATLKQSGGIYGGGVGSISDTVGALCAVDYKGAGNQYVNDGKCIIQSIRKPPER